MSLDLPKDYTTSRDVEFRVEPGLSWDESGGTLNLYPTDPFPQYLNIDIPTSKAAKVVATVTQPNFDVETSWLGWGVAVSNVGNGSEVMLVCEPGGPMAVIDLESYDTLTNANGRCSESQKSPPTPPRPVRRHRARGPREPTSRCCSGADLPPEQCRSPVGLRCGMFAAVPWLDCPGRARSPSRATDAGELCPQPDGPAAREREDHA